MFIECFRQGERFMRQSGRVQNTQANNLDRDLEMKWGANCGLGSSDGYHRRY
jgi:hypothetical protein